MTRLARCESADPGPSIESHQKRGGTDTSLGPWRPPWRTEGAHRLRPDPRRADIELSPRELPDLPMYYVLQLAAGSEGSARTEVDRQLEALGIEPAPT